MKYGYARTSAEDQTTALQLAGLRRAGAPTSARTRAYQGPAQSARPLRGASERFERVTR